MKIIKKRIIKIVVTVMIILVINMFYGQMQINANEDKTLIQQQLECFKSL